MKRYLAIAIFTSALGLAVAQETPAGSPQTPAAPQAEQQAPAAAPQPKPQIALTNLATRQDIPTFSELYCNGLITSSALKQDTLVVGGEKSPQMTRFETGEYIYLQGPGLEEGVQLSLLRHYNRSKQYEAYKGQASEIKKLGEIYEDLGRARVQYMRGKTAVAKIEYSCSEVTLGDFAIPFMERQAPVFRHAPINTFDPPSGLTAGHIVMAQDDDYLVGLRRIVYLSMGSNKGLKPGDYLRVTRNYTAVAADPADKLSYKASVAETTQKNPMVFDVKKRAGELPRLTLGELMVLSVSPNSATGLTTLAYESMRVGDDVELEAEKPQPVVPAPPEPKGPTIGCVATPGTVRVGDTARISCDANSPDNRPLTIFFQGPAAALNQQNSAATLNTAGLQPGRVTITATVSDDRNLTASASSVINVEGLPPAPQASKIADIAFKSNSAVVDNRAKAILDDIALRLQRDSSATALLVGSIAPNERTALAANRAENAKTYLTTSKGIDPARVQTRAGAQQEGTKTDIWIVPAGAAIPPNAF